MSKSGKASLQEFASNTTSSIQVNEGLGLQTEASEDTKRVGYTREANMRDNGIRLSVGRIADTVPALNGYKVQVPDAGIIACSCMNLAGGLLYALPNFVVGDTVLVAMSKVSTVGIILGKLPTISKYGPNDPRSFVTLSDCFKPNIFQRSFLDTLTDGKNYLCPAWTFGSPMQKTDIGEFFMSSPGGCKFFMNPYMGYLAANDATGIWVFKDDSTLRVAGLNYQMLTAGTSEFRLNDNGECIEYAGSSFNSWEQFGYYKKPKKVIAIKEGWAKNKKEQSFKEPVEPNAKPYHPIQKYGGWIGQGIQTRITAPVKESKFTAAGSVEKKQRALSAISQLADGFIGIESAKGISIVKRSFMPSIQMTYAPDFDMYGDNPDNYDFDHSEFKVYGEPELNAGTVAKVMQALMAIDDYSTYVCNYKPYSAFLNHKKDWFIPEEDNIKKGNPDLARLIRSLRSKDIAQEPSTYNITINGQQQKYYATEAGLHFLPNGGVVLYDGYGSEIKMAGGQITISAPGGIWLKSGKDIRQWAGKDINLRAKGCIDETSSKGSVRIKAEKNMEIIGGNAGGSSGVVIESRGSGDMDFSEGGDKVKVGGIVMRAAKGTASVLANTVYIRSGIESSGNGIMIDAGKGRSNIYTASNEKNDYVNQRHVLNFGDFETGSVSAVQESRADMATIPGRLDIGGLVTVLDSVYVEEGVYAGDHFYSKRAKTDHFVDPIANKGETMFNEHIMRETVYVNSTLPNDEIERYSGSVRPMFYEDKKPGNDTVLKQAEFSFRTDEELKLKNFCVYADRWQTVCDVGAAWEEPKVETATEKGQYPFPGKKYLKDENCYATQELELKEKGVAKNRKEGDEVVDKYKKPKYKEPVMKPLSEMKVLGD